MCFGIHFIASIGATNDIHSQTSILYRDLLGEDTKDLSLANEVQEFPIPVNRSGTEKMHDSPFLHWSFSEIYLPRRTFFHETNTHVELLGKGACGLLCSLSFSFSAFAIGM